MPAPDGTDFVTALRSAAFGVAISLLLCVPLGPAQEARRPCTNTAIFLEAPSPDDPTSMLDIPVAVLAFLEAEGVDTDHFDILVTSIENWNVQGDQLCPGSPLVVGPDRSQDVAKVQLSGDQASAVLVSATVSEPGRAHVDVVGDNAHIAQVLAKHCGPECCYWSSVLEPALSGDRYLDDLRDQLELANVPACANRRVDCTVRTERPVVAIGHPASFSAELLPRYHTICPRTLYLADSLATSSVVRTIRSSTRRPRTVFGILPALQKRAPDAVHDASWYWGRGMYAWLSTHCQDGRCTSPSALRDRLMQPHRPVGYVLQKLAP